MDFCILPATGIDGGAALLAGIGALAIGTVAVVSTRRRAGRTKERRGAWLGRTALAVPLIAVTLAATAPAPAARALECPPAMPPVTTEFTPGAAGIGDAYFPLDGNGGYDVQNYDLDLAFDPITKRISGTAAITLTASQNLSAFNLDFDTRDENGVDRLVISDLRIDGRTSAYSLATTQISGETAQPLTVDEDPAGAIDPPRTELTVLPDAGIPTGTTLTVEVDYAGVPILVDDAFGAAGVFPTADGMVIVGEPRVAATWFPANDHPADKATMTMSMSVPDGLDVIGNGELRSESSEGGRTTFVYVMDEPMATYLATATVGAYDIAVSQVDGVTYRNAVAESLLVPGKKGADAQTLLGVAPDAVAFLEMLYGDYPFTESGGIVVDVRRLGFALENQTRPIYPYATDQDGDLASPDETTIVHELAHQWVGDDVALARWSDIWLNEGFASYSESLYSEATGGDTAQEIFDAGYARDAGDDFWTGIVDDPGPSRIFDDFVYERGAMTLHALRAEVGDDVFFRILRGWAQGNAGGNVTTAQFEAYASQMAGRDLSELFDTWLRSGAKPAERPVVGP